MAALRAEVQTFIVTSLACYERPTRVAEAVLEEFGITVTRMQVAFYDPTKSPQLAKRWRELFDKTRAELDKQVASVPIAHQVARLRVIQRAVDRAENAKNSVLALAAAKQAAEEIGGIFVNRQKVAGDEQGDEPVAVKVERGVKDARRQTE